MLFQILLQALNTLHSQQGKWETQRLQLLWDRKLLKLGVWQRHTGLKNWRLAAAPFAIQLLSKLPCQLWDKQKLDSRLQMPQNREEQQAKRREIDWCWHPLNRPYQILGQEASMLPTRHLPAMCMGAARAPSTSWRMAVTLHTLISGSFSKRCEAAQSVERKSRPVLAMSCNHLTPRVTSQRMLWFAGWKKHCVLKSWML